MLFQVLYYCATFLLGLSLSLYLTAILRRAAVRWDVLDRPDGALKRQEAAVPYLGGVAIYLAFMITLSVVFSFRPQLLGLLLGGTMVAMLGLFDDLRVLPAGLKLLGQCLIVWIMLKSEISIQLVALPMWLNIPLTVAWLLGITNAFNLIDVSDGLSAGVATIAGFGLFVVALLNGDAMIATTTLALVGSLLGFLYFNKPPARIYMGDTGSLFIGLMLASLSMIGKYTPNVGAFGIVAPLFLLVVPLMETVLVSLARIKVGQSPMRGSRDHFALRLAHRGWSKRRIALYGGALGAMGAAIGIAVLLMPVGVGVRVALGALLFFSGHFVWWWWLGAPPHANAVQAAQPREMLTEGTRSVSS